MRKPFEDEGLRAVSRALSLPLEQLRHWLQGSHVCDWQTDPFARGAYSYVRAGGVDAVAELARPCEETLFFAGEATQSGFGGTVASAIASGYRAADEIIRSLAVIANE